MFVFAPHIRASSLYEWYKSDSGFWFWFWMPEVRIWSSRVLPAQPRERMTDCKRSRSVIICFSHTVPSALITSEWWSINVKRLLTGSSFPASSFYRIKKKQAPVRFFLNLPLSDKFIKIFSGSFGIKAKTSDEFLTWIIRRFSAADLQSNLMI